MVELLGYGSYLVPTSHTPNESAHIIMGSSILPDEMLINT